MNELRPCIDCGRLTLGSLDAAGEQAICWRPCWHLRQVKRAAAWAGVS